MAPILVHLLDLSPITERTPLDDFKKMNKELEKYSKELARKQQLVVLNKIDLYEDDQFVEGIIGQFKSNDIDPLIISAVTGKGVRELIYKIAELLGKHRQNNGELL